MEFHSRSGAKMRGTTLKPVMMTVVAAIILGGAMGGARPEDAQAPTQSAPPADHPATPDNPPAPAPTPAPAPAPTTPPPTPPATVTILNDHEVQGILGRDVESTTANENMGRIVDVLVDRGGQVRAAIIDFGGFLGVGSRKIAVDWNALHFPQPAKPDAHITLDLSRDQVKAAPEYQEGKPVVVLGPLGKLEQLPFE
jgi:PRC-barrel domain